MVLRKMFLNINGVERIIMCDADSDTLADVIRRLGLTGTKVGCGTGQCGSCSILLDGKVTRSCTKKMKTVPEFSNITTIEGIGTPTNLHPIQLAWIVYGGVQCGFCSPGFIVSAKGLLDSNPSPTRQEVRDWFQKNRNACRCTGYKPLVDAVMAAAEVMRGEKTMQDLEFKMPADGRIYDTKYPRPAALSKVTGTCDYGADINAKLPQGEVLHLAMVMARVNHAKVLSVDFSEAEKMPGVHKVITYKDVKGINRVTWPTGSALSKANGFERPFLVEDTVYRYGDVIALVAADTEKQARAAAKKVIVKYEQLPEYMTALEAVADDAMDIHKGIPNMYWEQPLIHGEDTKPIMESAPYVAEGSFYVQRQPHLIIEPDSSLAYIDEAGRLTIHCKTLAVAIPIKILAAGFGLKPEQIRVIENPTGASFGYSVSPGNAALVGVAALATGMPCCLDMNYEEHNHFSGKRAPAFTNLKMAADKNGKLVAMEFDTAYEKGAYTENANVITKAPRFMGAPYTIPNAIGISKAVTSNHNFTTAFRAFGSPQVFPASESLMDELAEQIGMDPLEFRYINVYKEGDTNINGHGFDVYPMQKILDALRPKYKEALDRAKKESTPEKLRGVGIACGEYNVTSGPNDHCENDLELNPDGTVTVFNSWEDQGQGADIGTLVHAHESLRPLGLSPEQIRLVMNDTAICPISGAAAGSRSHYMNGLAIIDGANKLMNAMRKPDGTYRTYDEMVKESIPTKYRGVSDTTTYTAPLNDYTYQGTVSPTADYMFNCNLAEVEVDVKTGKTKVLRMTIVEDIGVVGNQLAVEGQAYGGMVQGVGLALSENYEDVKKHTSLIACGMPFINDAPDDMEVINLDSHRPRGPHGSTGCSESHLSSPHAAIINAIYNATKVRIRVLPATPDKVLKGLEELKNGAAKKPGKYYLGTPNLHERISEIKKIASEAK